MESLWISAFLGLPLFFAFICLALAPQLKWVRVFSYIGFSAQAILALCCLLKLSSGSRFFFLSMGDWPASMAINMLFDPFAGLMILISSVVLLSGSIFSSLELAKSEEQKFFWSLLHLLQLGLNGAFLTADLFNLFVFYELILISSFALLVLRSTRESRKATSIYLLLNLFSSGIFLLGLGLLYEATGSLNFAIVSDQLKELPSSVSTWISIFFLFSFSVKAGLFPLFFWLPISYPHLAGSLGGIFGGLLTKVGLYSIIRVFPSVLPLPAIHFEILLWVSAITILLGVIAAYSQKEVRNILSFHILSQVGYIAGAFAVAGLSTDPDTRLLALSMCIFYICHHILVKSTLFFSSGMMLYQFKSSSLDQIAGLRIQSPLLAILFALPAMSLAGIPPFSGFWAKIGVLQAGFDAGLWLYVVPAIVAGFLTLLSMHKIWSMAFQGKASATNETDRSPIPVSGILAGLIILIPSLSISLYPQWLFSFASQAAVFLLEPEVYFEVLRRF